MTVRPLADSPEPAKGAAPVAATITNVEEPTKDAGVDRAAFTNWQWVGVGAAGLGAVSLGTAGVFALMATSKNKDSGCTDGICRDAASLALNEDARSYGDLATVMLVTGGVLVGAGAALFFMPPDRGSTGSASATSYPEVWLGPTSVRVRARF